MSIKNEDASSRTFDLWVDSETYEIDGWNSWILDVLLNVPGL
jgi:hypothetical protein